MNTGVKQVNMSAINLVYSFYTSRLAVFYHPEVRKRRYFVVIKLCSLPPVGPYLVMDSIGTACLHSLYYLHWALSPLSWGCLWHLHFGLLSSRKEKAQLSTSFDRSKGDQQRIKNWSACSTPCCLLGDVAAVNPFPHPGPLALSRAADFVWKCSDIEMTPLATLLRVVSRVMNCNLKSRSKSKNESTSS